MILFHDYTYIWKIDSYHLVYITIFTDTIRVIRYEVVWQQSSKKSQKSTVLTLQITVAWDFSCCICKLMIYDTYFPFPWIYNLLIVKHKTQRQNWILSVCENCCIPSGFVKIVGFPICLCVSLHSRTVGCCHLESIFSVSHSEAWHHKYWHTMKTTSRCYGFVFLFNIFACPFEIQRRGYSVFSAPLRFDSNSAFMVLHYSYLQTGEGSGWLCSIFCVSFRVMGVSNRILCLQRLLIRKTCIFTLRFNKELAGFLRFYEHQKEHSVRNLSNIITD